MYFDMLNVFLFIKAPIIVAIIEFL